MPQNLTQRTVNTFIKGLITEAGELTFPPDASVDELNCDLLRDGTRRRRKGLTKEESYELSSFTVTDSTVVTTGDWYNAGGVPGVQYLVVQAGATLYFYNKAGASISSNVINMSVDLTPYEVAGGVGASEAKCKFTSIKGVLIVVSEAINPIYLETDILQATVTATEIDFKVRDFDWQGDTTEYYESKATPSDERKYDTQNAGWVAPNGDTALTSYQSAHSSEYPPLTHAWYSGKTSTGTFSSTEWDKIYSGNTLTGNGHYLLDFFAKDRATASGITGLSTEIEETRFKTVATFAGRVFYAGLDSTKNTDTIIFSQLVDKFSQLGYCYQQNDPTSEQISDLLATDGGVIKIAGAAGIKVLYVIDASLYVFADNGVWRIEGIDGVFSPTAFAVRKVTDVGILNSGSFVVADGTPIWWSKNGIHTFQFDPSTGRPVESNLTLGTIQSYWDSIPNFSKSRTIASFDSVNKRVYWAWPDEDEPIASKVNNILVLDASIQAFFPWRVNDQESNSDCILGSFFYIGLGSSRLPVDVVLSNGDDVVTTDGDDVVSEQFVEETGGEPGVYFITKDNASSKITFSRFTSDSFLDWGDTDYTSFAEAGYDFMGDLLLKKTAPYITTYMRVTETAFVDDGLGNYSLDKPSSMLVKAYWDFKDNPSSTAQQAYRFKYTITAPTFDYPEDVITTRLKLRGRGRSMRLRFESEEGKDFVLLGYSILGGVNPTH